jgi:methylated-DNA-[protein]-cysteine S-methyltransferase
VTTIDEATVARALGTLRVPAPSGFTDRVLGAIGHPTEPDVYVRVQSGLGDAFVAWSAQGITRVVPCAVVDDDANRFEAAYRDETGREIRTGSRAPAGIQRALQNGDGRHLTYDLSSCTPFERAVLETTLEIPAGEIRPYGWVAGRIGRPRAVRAVGTALGRNPVPLLIPCHRVVRSDGDVGNYGFGTENKRALLAHEHVDLVALDRYRRTGTRVIGTVSTHIACLPSCASLRRVPETGRAPFSSLAAAEAEGFRSCRRCMPDAMAG